MGSGVSGLNQEQWDQVKGDADANELMNVLPAVYIKSVAEGLDKKEMVKELQRAISQSLLGDEEAQAVNQNDAKDPKEASTAIAPTDEKGATPIAPENPSSVPTTIKIAEEEVPVSGEPNVDVGKCLTAKIFTDWIQNLDKIFKVGHIHFQSLDMFGKKVGFIKMKADIVNRQTGQFVPGIAFLRGGAISILVVITCGDKDYVVLTVQARVPVSGNPVELPAGMLDGSQNFAGKAAEELKEEVGISITSDKLLNLGKLAWNHERGMFPSPGGCDEFINLYLYKTKMEQSELDDLSGRLTGNLLEGETIKLKVIPYADLWKESNDAKSLCSVALYDRMKDMIDSEYGHIWDPTRPKPQTQQETATATS